MQKIFNTTIYITIFFSLLLINSCETEEEENNNTAMGYNCTQNNECIAAENGQYLTLQDCLSICNNNQTSTWNCINSSCVEANDGNGIFNSLNECQSSCNNNTLSWNCINSSCVEANDGNGIFNSLNECQSECENIVNCNNSFTVDNTGPYYIDGLSEVINFGNFYNSSTTNYELRLFSENISTTGSGNYNGNGNMIYLNLHTNGTIAGSYTFNNNGWNPSVNTFDGGYFTNQNMYDYSMGMIFPTAANSGTIEIIDNGSYNYDVNINFNNNQGINILGCFSGNVNPYSGGSGSGGSGSSGSSGSFGVSQETNNNPKKF